MGFFVFDNDGAMKLSGVTWIYPAMVVPLTTAVFVTWFSWIRLRPNRVQKEVEALGLSIKRRDTAAAATEEP
jgi:hypothetical protein